MPVLIAAMILIFTLEYTKKIDTQKMLLDNIDYLNTFKEPDYDFLVHLFIGEDAEPDVLFAMRLRNGMLVVLMLFMFFILNLQFVNLVAALGLGFFVYKLQYWKFKGRYKSNINTYSMMLPYYLKTLEILIQHYTVPVAMAKSIVYAPEVFRPGLRKMIASINAGDSSIDPYMNFAHNYPVRDSFRMMRLLYRLSLGEQDNKQDRLLTFSRSVSTLQNKAREMKYAERLKKMEDKTMLMLICTGGGTMIVLVISMLMTFSMVGG